MAEEKTSRDREPLTPKFGTEFVTKFYRLLKGTTVYDRKNPNIDRLIQECLLVIYGVVQSEGNLILEIVRDHFFFNNNRVQVKADRFGVFKAFRHEMRRRRIGEIEFLSEVGAEDLKEFVYLLSGLDENNENNYLSLNKQLETRNIDSIRVSKLEFSHDEEISVDSESQKRFSKEIYFKSIGLAKEIVESIRQQKTVNIRKAKRLMQSVVRAMNQDDSTLLGLANIKNYDEYLFNHAVNVAVYAIALGLRLGIPKKYLSHLGMAALFHDIGKAKIPEEILQKEGKLSPEEWSLMRSHPVSGTELILKMKEWSGLSTRMIDGAFEHHLRYDFTGYPRLIRKKKLSLFGRIIAIADFYDAFARPRVYNRFPYVSEKILGVMLDRSGKAFDPSLLKVFINFIGIFPVGALVLLNTNEMGMVIRIPEDSEMIDHPTICLLSYGDGEYRKGESIDLKEIDEEAQDFRRSIVKTIDPNEYNINISEFFV